MLEVELMALGKATSPWYRLEKIDTGGVAFLERKIFKECVFSQ